MFDNLGTALVQAVGFFGVFGFFVYQLLLDSKTKNKTQLKFTKKNSNQSKNTNDKPKNKSLFGKKTEPIKKEFKPRGKGLFGRKVETVEVLEKPKKKGWFK